MGHQACKVDEGWPVRGIARQQKNLIDVKKIGHLTIISKSRGHLRPVVLDVVGRLGEDLRLLDGVDEDLSLRGAAPVGLGVPKYDSSLSITIHIQNHSHVHHYQLFCYSPPEDVDGEDAEEADGDGGVDIIHCEHQHDAHHRREQRHPLVVPGGTKCAT